MYCHALDTPSGQGFALSRSPVPPVPAVPVYAAWHADDIPAQADDSELATWQPRIGTVPLIKNGSIASGKYRTNFEDGDGLSCVEFVAANSSQMIADAIAAPFSGTNVPVFIYVFAMATTNADDQALFSFGNSASSNAYMRLRVDTDQIDADRMIVFRSDNTPTLVSNTSLTPGLTDVTGPLGFTLRFTGSTLDYACGKREVNSVAASLGAATFDRFTLAGFRRSGGTVSNFYSGKIRAIIVSQTALTDAQLAECDDWARGFAPGRIKDIVCSGDSLTDGLGGTTQLGGYRRGLWDHIHENKYAADMAGEAGDQLKGNWPRRQASSTSSWQVHQIRADLNATLATLTNVGLVILMAGSNNTGTNLAAVAAGAEQYAGLLRDVIAAHPNVRIAVTRIPAKNIPDHAANVVDFNQRLRGEGAYAGIGIWEVFEAEYPGVLVYGWDTIGVYPTWDADAYDDDIHFNDVGYSAILNDSTDGLWQAVEPIIATW